MKYLDKNGYEIKARQQVVNCVFLADYADVKLHKVISKNKTLFVNEKPLNDYINKRIDGGKYTTLEII